jgi:3-deoxy-D-manno-octulosonate 8-phosphate phosphatase KdsC-like HAD superfamily phosphatase
MRTEYTKGVSATFLKEKLGARVLVGMGDYENDVPLFEKCDISFAVANAVEPLKNIATYVTRATVGESAAAEIIETLERMIRAGEIQVKCAN